MAILFFAVLIIAVAVIFAAQNGATVTLSFITWKFTASLAIIVFLALLAGMVIMGLLWIGASFKTNVKKRATPDKVTTIKDGPTTQPGLRGPQQ